MPNPTAVEQLYLEWINRMRADPSAEARLLFPSVGTGANSNITRAIEYFKVNRDAFIRAMDSFSSAAPVGWNGDLKDAAIKHNRRMIAADEQSHQLSGEPDLLARVEAEGYGASNGVKLVGENVYLWSLDSLYGHAAFVIDWGNGPNGMQNPAGHRDLMMHKQLTEVGISVVRNTDTSKTAGPYVITQDFGTTFGARAMLVGVAIRDADGDKFYDIGEGLGGVTITARLESGGAAVQTTSWQAGGYQLTLDPGRYIVTYSGGGLSSPVTRKVTIGDVNVKSDLILANISGRELVGGDGSDQFTGSMRDDIILGNGGSDLLRGSSGNDTVTGGAGADTIEGGGGNDSISGGSWGDVLRGNAGHDTVEGGLGADRAWLGDGNDRYSDTSQTGALGADWVAGGAGKDVLLSGGGNDTCYGGVGSDTIWSGEGNDLVYGGSWNDTIRAGGGNDTVRGDAGRDVVYLDSGDDLFIDDLQGGGSGADKVFGGGGHDTIRGLGGDDTLNGGAGVDIISGGGGNDVIDGGGWNDVIRANAGHDTVYGGAGADKIWLGDGNDVFQDSAQTGPSGSDWVSGGAGADVIRGGGGNDTLNGGSGQDTLSGGEGGDVFVFAKGDGADQILDVSQAQGDHIVISTDLQGGASNVSDLVANHAISTGDGLKLVFADGDSLLVHGVTTTAELEAVLQIGAVGGF